MVVEILLSKHEEILLLVSSEGQIEHQSPSTPKKYAYYNCVFCGLNVEEDLAHLLFDLPIFCGLSVHSAIIFVW